MANRRMFTMSIVDSDAFLEMPLTTQALYFHLNMRADDDGFIGNPKKIMRIINASEDDLKLLMAKRFILVFENGVIVIKHWRMHNTIKSDRYTPTAYQDELNQLFIKSNKSYTLEVPTETKCLQNVSSNGNEMETRRKQNGNDMEPECFQSDSKNGNNVETKCLQNVSTDIGLNLGKDKDIDLNTHTINLENQEKNKNQENVCVESDSLPENNNSVSDQQKYYAKLVFDIWEKSDLPRPKTGYITFLMRDFKLALVELQKQHLHSDDVIKACENYATVINMSRKGQSWWASKSSFDNFVKPGVISRFLPDYFDIENFREKSDKKGSAISRSNEYSNVEIDF